MGSTVIDGVRLAGRHDILSSVFSEHWYYWRKNPKASRPRCQRENEIGHFLSKVKYRDEAGVSSGLSRLDPELL